MESVTEYCTDLFDCAYFRADFQMQANDNTNEVKTFKASMLKNRLKLLREGPMANGQTYRVTDLLNFRLVISAALPPTVRGQWKAWAAQYDKVITVTEAQPVDMDRALVDAAPAPAPAPAPTPVAQQPARAARKRRAAPTGANHSGTRAVRGDR